MKGDRCWKKETSIFELDDFGGKYYCFAATHSGHDYPARITNDPEFSEPPDFDVEIHSIDEAYCDGEEMSKAEIDAFMDDNHEAVYQALIDSFSM